MERLSNAGTRQLTPDQPFVGMARRRRRLLFPCSENVNKIRVDRRSSSFCLGRIGRRRTLLEGCVRHRSVVGHATALATPLAILDPFRPNAHQSRAAATARLPPLTKTHRRSPAPLISLTRDVETLRAQSPQDPNGLCPWSALTTLLRSSAES
jgi:hypothetical protein